MKNRSVDVHQFSMIPRADIPRSSFRMQKSLKTAFDSGFLVPIMYEEVLPGDTFNCKMTAFCRLATPIFPFMDNVYLETFFFFVPNRLVWNNWERFMGEQDNPADSISYVVPQLVSPVSGYVVGSIGDYFGLPTVGQVTGGNTFSHSALPLRGYNLIYNEWFRDENLQNSLTVSLTDGPDSQASYALRRRGKRHDYFTSCLPWTQKGGVAVTIGMTGNAIVKTDTNNVFTGVQSPLRWLTTGGGAPVALAPFIPTAGPTSSTTQSTVAAIGATGAGMYPSNLYADLSTATATTINQLRQSFQVQKLLERDARGGSRYTELVRSHFGVTSPDARLNRSEYLGGGKTPISLHPVSQTSVTATTPQGNLAAFATGVAREHGFSQSFTEHGMVIGFAQVNADLNYQQGLRKSWSRSTRYDFYFPVFAALGEQAVLNKEIYLDGSSNDSNVFGYQERWAEYRYNPSQITGLMRSTSAGTIDAWHLAQRFTVLPTLNSTFIEDTPPLSRVLAVGAAANGQQLLFDGFFDMKVARPMPMYSVPGLVDHF